MPTSAKKTKALKKAPVSFGTDPAFTSVVNALAKEPGVTFIDGKGFGSRALKVNGKIFAMVSSKGQFVVKLPGARVSALVSSSTGEYFDAGKGKPMKEWLAVPGRTDLWVKLAKEAYRFVNAST